MSEAPERILILGGTKEAAQLAARLVAEGNYVMTSLAGRTREPQPVAGDLRIGGFSNDRKTGADALADFIQAGDFHRLIDATHPFAKQISQHACKAAEITGIAFETVERPPWKKNAGDNWHTVPDLETAARVIPPKTRVLLALGRQHIEPFTRRADVYFIIRMVDPPKEALPFAHATLIVGKPSADWREEAALLQSQKITHIVCRNSGGEGAYAKIEAARNLRLPVIILDR